jgi:hypothetical protein
MAYTKLFSSIVTSTIWTEDDRTRIVWITMLACADRNGEVQASIPGLARIAGVPVEDCRTAIHKFLSPDLDSRTKDDEGRRIEEIDGGWSILNYRKYRDMASDEDRRNQAAVRQQRARDKKSRNSHEPVTPESRQIPQAEAEAEAEAEADKAPKGATSSRKPSMADDEFIAELKKNPAYNGIDIDREIGKMRAWLTTPRGRSRKFTRTFVVNWLNRVDVPMATGSATEQELASNTGGQW